MAYRDIRADLQERVADIRALRKSAEDEYRAKVRDLDEREKALQKLLDDENKRFPSLLSPPSLGQSFAGTPSELAMIALSDDQPHHLDEIKAKAEQLGMRPSEGVHLGRILHGALVSLLREGRVEQLGEGKWKRIDEKTLAQNRARVLFE